MKEITDSFMDFVLGQCMEDGCKSGFHVELAIIHGCNSLDVNKAIFVLLLLALNAGWREGDMWGPYMARNPYKNPHTYFYLCY